MVLSITQPTVPERKKEHLPLSSPPWVWFGFVFALAFFVLEVLMVIMELEEAKLSPAFTLIGLGGWIYWIVCVHRIHKILAELTHERYPITAAEAAGKHFIPFYNIYWIIKWPVEISRYLNDRQRVRMIHGAIVGVLLLLAALSRLVDGAVGLAMLFGVTLYISAKLKRHVQILKDAQPENLPPLPDPRVFGSPTEVPAELSQPLPTPIE